jgi:hypothetical protein
MWITWKHQDTDLTWPLSYAQKVDLFYEQALGWQLHIADLVANGGKAFGEEGDCDGINVNPIRHSGFAVLQICLSYFETIGYYTTNASSGKKAFTSGVIQVFPDLAKLDPVVVTKRCGLYHNTRTARAILGQPTGKDAIALAEERIVISPERLPTYLKAHLSSLRNHLLREENVDLRATFERRFDKDSGMKQTKRQTCLNRLESKSHKYKRAQRA